MHRICKVTVAALAALLAGTSTSAADAPSDPSVAEIASFATLAPKTMTLGRLLANPLVPPLLLSTMQQNIASTYGKVRSDKPLFWVLGESGEHCHDVPVLPLAEGIAQFTLNNPGSTRPENGCVLLPTTDDRPTEMIAAFDKTDGYAAFAPTAAHARRALAATAAARKAAPSDNTPVARIHIGERSYSLFNMSAAGTNGVDVAKKIASFDAALFLDDSGLRLEASFIPKPGVSPAALCSDLEKTVGASLVALGKDDGCQPVCRFTHGEKNAKAVVSLPAAEMAKAGKAFNAAVVQALAPSTKQGKPPAQK